MDENEKYYARTQYRLKISELIGNSFEDFFVQIMKYNCTEFESVKPWGRLGDRKNDGFIKSKGVYYQVYSPEDPSIRLNQAISKLKEDFAKLYEYWQDKYPIKEYYFVFNDKHTNPSLETELSDLSKKYTPIKFDVLLNDHLESIFINLEKSMIQILIGGIPTADELLKNIEFSVLPLIIHHILSFDFEDPDETQTIAPDFDEKITFNKLTSPRSLLESAYFQLSNLKDYFSEKPDEKEIIKIKFSYLYQESRKKHPDNQDMQFYYILYKASPNKTLPVVNATIVLMTLYFEYCDIFEEPR